MRSIAPMWLKRTTMTIGTILVIIGMPFTLNLLCLVPFALLNSSDSETTQYAIVSLTLALLTVGAGITAYWHADHSLKNKPSKLLQLPPAIVLAAAFIPLLLLGIIMQLGDVGFLLGPILMVSAILPPLWAIAWMIPQSPGNGKRENTTEQDSVEVESTNLTWRRGLLIFSAGATLSVLTALALEILLPVLILSLVSGFADAMSAYVSSIVRALSNFAVAEAITNPGFVFVFLQIVVIAPIVEEFAKPIVTLPLLKNISRREAFWVGAIAGAGFAALENIIYSTIGISIWAGILLVRAIGSALHPLGAGLVAMGWWSVINLERGASSNWWRRFGIAVALHAAWNGGSLLVIALGSAGFFGRLPPKLDVLGVSAAGAVLAFLILLGIAALWIGRTFGHNTAWVSQSEVDAQAEVGSTPSDRTIAVWALICLFVILPLGIAGLKLWLP